MTAQTYNAFVRIPENLSDLNDRLAREAVREWGDNPHPLGRGARMLRDMFDPPPETRDLAVEVDALGEAGARERFNEHSNEHSVDRSKSARGRAGSHPPE